MMVWRAAKNAVKSIDCGQDCGKEWAVQQNTVCAVAGFDISGGFLQVSMSYLQYELLGYEVYMLCSGGMTSQFPAIFFLCESTLVSCTQIWGHFTFSDDLVLFVLVRSLIMIQPILRLI
jgi:hypothetical protein